MCPKSDKGCHLDKNCPSCQKSGLKKIPQSESGKGPQGILWSSYRVFYYRQENGLTDRLEIYGAERELDFCLSIL